MRWMGGVALLAALSVAAPARADTASALSCPTSLAGVTRAPVLLIPGTNLEPKANFDWNYEPALTAAKIPWCAVTLPRYAMGDIQDSAENVVAALRQMYAAAGRRVSIIGFSQGGMIGRWALKFWPDTRAMVEDLIGLAPSNHGTLSADPLCSASCPAAYWQQRSDAKFTAALNQGPETWAGIDYTVAFTNHDEVVTPNLDARTGSSALRTGDGRIANVLIQSLCPADSSDHLALGSFDAVGWALALDALTHDGPADPGRIDTAAVCAQPFMPGVDPASFASNYARYVATVAQGAAQADYVAAEPPLKCYVTSSCPAPALAPARRPCTRPRRIVWRLDGRLRHALVTVNGHRAPVRRRHGRLVALLDLRGDGSRTVTVRVRGTTRGGHRLARTRRLRVCGQRR